VIASYDPSDRRAALRRPFDESHSHSASFGAFGRPPAMTSCWPDQTTRGTPKSGPLEYGPTIYTMVPGGNRYHSMQ
jgi:hypothetical protein